MKRPTRDPKKRQDVFDWVVSDAITNLDAMSLTALLEPFSQKDVTLEETWGGLIDY